MLLPPSTAPTCATTPHTTPTPTSHHHYTPARTSHHRKPGHCTGLYHFYCTTAHTRQHLNHPQQAITFLLYQHTQDTIPTYITTAQHSSTSPYSKHHSNHTSPPKQPSHLPTTTTISTPTQQDSREQHPQKLPRHCAASQASLLELTDEPQDTRTSVQAKLHQLCCHCLVHPSLLLPKTPATPHTLVNPTPSHPTVSSPRIQKCPLHPSLLLKDSITPKVLYTTIHSFLSRLQHPKPCTPHAGHSLGSCSINNLSTLWEMEKEGRRKGEGAVKVEEEGGKEKEEKGREGERE